MKASHRSLMDLLDPAAEVNWLAASPDSEGACVRYVKKRWLSLRAQRVFHDVGRASVPCLIIGRLCVRSKSENDAPNVNDNPAGVGYVSQQDWIAGSLIRGPR
jgi:hypothetical protein